MKLNEIIKKEIEKKVIPEICEGMVTSLCQLAFQNDYFYTEIHPFSDNSGAFKMWFDR